MATWLVTGGNRGIGLELTRRLRARGDDVLVACRRESPALRATGAEVRQGIDVTDRASVERLAKCLNGRRLDVLVNCAGILTRETLDDLDYDRIRRQFEVNAIGPLRITEALLPSLGPGSKVAIVSSRSRNALRSLVPKSSVSIGGTCTTRAFSPSFGSVI